MQAVVYVLCSGVFSAQPVKPPIFLGVYHVVEIMNIAIANGFSEDNNFDKADINRCKLEYFFIIISKIKTLLKYF